MKLGYQGEDVRQLQCALALDGEKLAHSSIIDTPTSRAIMRALQRYGLSSDTDLKTLLGKILTKHRVVPGKKLKEGTPNEKKFRASRLIGATRVPVSIKSFGVMRGELYGSTADVSGIIKEFCDAVNGNQAYRLSIHASTAQHDISLCSFDTGTFEYYSWLASLDAIIYLPEKLDLVVLNELLEAKLLVMCSKIPAGYSEFVERYGPGVRSIRTAIIDTKVMCHKINLAYAHILSLR